MDHRFDIAADGGGRSPQAEAGLTPQAHDQIGRQLRRLYQDMLSEPLPDRFSKLLDVLSDKDDPSQAP